MSESKNGSKINYTVLLCVDYDEQVLRRYNELLKLCEIQGGSTHYFDNLYISQRKLRVTEKRTIQYDLILGLGGEDAADIANRVYGEGGEIAVAFFDLKCNNNKMISYIKSVKEIFPSLICAVAIKPEEKDYVDRPAQLFSSPSEWLYFLSNYTPEQMEQLIAHLISSFVLHREKEIALAKNEATRKGLRQILKASPEFLKKQSKEKLGEFIIEKLQTLSGSKNAYLLTLDNKSNKLKYLTGIGKFANEEAFNVEYGQKDELLPKALETNKILRTQDCIFAPLFVQEKAVGLLCFDYEHRLTRDSELMEVFSHHVGFAIENQRIQIELEQKQAWEHELNLASRIQSSLLPKTFPEIPGIEVYGITKSAKEIGGDYFDVLESNKNFYICIGDVSGKGVPAGLIMSELRSFVRSFAMSYKSPKTILLQSAKLLLEDVSGHGKFVSMLLFQWNGKKLLYSSAGHEHIIHYKAKEGKCDTFRSGGVVLGVDIKNFSKLLDEKQLTWQKGDMILLFTDGATEAQNAKKEMYKLENLTKAAEKYNDLSPKEIIEKILKEIYEFAGDVEQHDDITLIVMKYTGNKVNKAKEVAKAPVKPKVEVDDPFNMSFD